MSFLNQSFRKFSRTEMGTGPPEKPKLAAQLLLFEGRYIMHLSLVCWGLFFFFFLNGKKGGENPKYSFVQTENLCAVCGYMTSTSIDGWFWVIWMLPSQSTYLGGLLE